MTFDAKLHGYIHENVSRVTFFNLLLGARPMAQVLPQNDSDAQL
jgi:hypothetical protein